MRKLILGTLLIVSTSFSQDCGVNNKIAPNICTVLADKPDSYIKSIALFLGESRDSNSIQALLNNYEIYSDSIQTGRILPSPEVVSKLLKGKTALMLVYLSKVDVFRAENESIVEYIGDFGIIPNPVMRGKINFRKNVSDIQISRENIEIIMGKKGRITNRSN